MSTELVVAQRPAAPSALDVVQVVLDGVSSRHTRRAYERALRDFIAWCLASGRTRFDKAAVQRHVAELRERGVGAASINQRLAAIRRFALEAGDAGLIAQEQARAIEGAKGFKQAGQRLGHWLSAAEAGQLINAPDGSTVKGLRDRALLAVLVGCGLRRHEAAGLTWAHVQQREGRWMIVDLRGKGNKLRSVPMPGWAQAALSAWGAVSGSEGPIFRQVGRHGHVLAQGISEQTVRAVVVQAASVAGLGDVAPHDLRRTFAKLARVGGAELEQIQLSLGHASVQTTERYLGTAQRLDDAPCDRLGIAL